MASNIPGSWPLSKIIQILATRNAMCALRGRPCPIASAVVARMEGK